MSEKPKGRLKVASTNAAVVPIGVVQPGRLVHAIAHTARLQLSLEKPGISAAAKKVYQEALDDYQTLFSQIDPDAIELAKAEIGDRHKLGRDGGISDLTPTHIRAAIQHLEG